ncbi:MAG TPA: hypothetical protein VIL36_23675 [Acidimicrobiales bacterium]
MAASDDDVVDVIDAMAALRRARPRLPDEVTSPASAAAQALLEGILSMPTHPPVEIDLVPSEPAPGDDPLDPLDTPATARRPGRGRRPAVLVAAAALAVAGIAAAAIATAGDGRDGTPEPVEVGPAAGERRPFDSGRVRTTWTLEWDMVTDPISTTSTIEWSGDDFAEEGANLDIRQVDGRAWASMADVPESPPSTGVPLDELPHAWSEIDALPRPEILDLDLATLAEQLAGDGPFTPVGTEDVEGVPTERRRASQPSSVVLDVLGLSPYFAGEATVTDLELWVDEDGLVRRVDVTVTGTGQGEAFTETWSKVWYDLGAPITIEPPDPADVDFELPEEHRGLDGPTEELEAIEVVEAEPPARAADAADAIEAETGG